jgi:hypothetical protein
LIRRRLRVGSCSERHGFSGDLPRFRFCQDAATDSGLCRRFNVLIHSKEIIGIVFIFDRDQPFVIPAIGFFHTFFAFIAH